MEKHKQMLNNANNFGRNVHKDPGIVFGKTIFRRGLGHIRGKTRAFLGRYKNQEYFLNAQTCSNVP